MSILKLGNIKFYEKNSCIDIGKNKIAKNVITFYMLIGKILFVIRNLFIFTTKLDLGCHKLIISTILDVSSIYL